MTINKDRPIRDGEWREGERAAFTYSLAPDPNSEISRRLHGRTGSIATIVERARDGVDDTEPGLSTLTQRADAGMLRVYVVTFEDGAEEAAFEDELSEVVL